MLDKIRNQLLLSFVLVALVPLLLVGGYCYSITRSTLYDNAINEVSDTAMFEMRRIETFLTGIKKDVLLMRDLPVLELMLGASDPNTYEANRRLLEKEFLAISKHKKSYYQVRFLDATGMEVVRIDSSGSESRIVDQGKLQNKGSRYYFKDAFVLKNDQIFVSKLDLNRERGKVERPLKPVIRYATPVFYNGEKRGIVLVNVFGDLFLKPLKSTNSQDGAYNILISNEGYYFSNPDAHREWGSITDLKSQEQIGEDFSPDVVNFLTNAQSGSERFEDHIIAQSIYYPDPANQVVFWKLARISNKDIVLAPVSTFVVVMLGLLAAAIILSLLLGMLISNKITKPIDHLTGVAEEISRGKTTVSIDVSGPYEIRTLAKSINRLKTSVNMLLKRSKANKG